MQSLSTLLRHHEPSRGGGRPSSPTYRQSLDYCNDFSGLEENASRYDLLLLVKKVGKQAGFTPRTIQLLDYYMAFTRDADWEQGSRPIVYQSLARTALDMGVSERQIQKLEQQLFSIGAITWNDSGNHKRYGQRDAATGRILYAYGVDLTPLAYLRTELEQKLHEKKLYDQAWLDTKREISWYRRQIRALLLELREEEAGSIELAALESEYDPIAYQLRTHIRLEKLRTLLESHRSLHSRVLELVVVESGESTVAPEGGDFPQETANGSSRNEQRFAHYKPTTHQSITCSPSDACLQKSVAETSEPDDLASATGLQHLTLGQVLLASSERFQGYLPLSAKPLSWSDVVEAAYQLRRELGVSQQSWSEACQALGRTGAAVCVVITDRATARECDPVQRPAAYFLGLNRKARLGQLRLQKSVFGLSRPTP
ncbi:MAG: plasmid replication protein RepC [Planctomycetota bacterium]